MRSVNRSLTRLSVFGLICAVIAGLLTAPPASASVSGRRTTAAALTGLAVYHLAKGHYPEGLALGGASVYAWGKVSEKKKEERARRYRYAKHSRRSSQRVCHKHHSHRH